MCFLCWYLHFFLHLRVLFKHKITFFEDMLSSFSLKHFFGSEGKCECLLLYPPEVLGGASNVLCTCWCRSSHWFLICSSGVLFRTTPWHQEDQRMQPQDADKTMWRCSLLSKSTRGMAKITLRCLHMKTTSMSSILAKLHTIMTEGTPGCRHPSTAIAHLPEMECPAETAHPVETSITPVPLPFDAANQLYIIPILNLPGLWLSICAKQHPTELQKVHPLVSAQ